MQTDQAIYREAAGKLADVRRAVREYNKFAAEHYMYTMGLYPNSDLDMAESGIPKEILREIYEKE